jgi:plasmid stabilization system protein ParE
MTFRVEVSAQAERDAETILDWLLSQHAGETGIRWLLALEDAIASLSAMPHRCSVAPESSLFPFEVRQLLYGRKPHLYRILFAIEGDKVEILHIRHARRRPITSP